MPKRKIVIANWKMNPLTLKEAQIWVKKIGKELRGIKKTEVVICPPYLYLQKLESASRRTRKISLGAQDAFWGEVGPFTGEISGEMLYNLGIKYVLLGHSERRALGDTNMYVNKKLKSALAAGLTPILCLGENVRDQDHQYFNIVKDQIKECLQGVNKNLFPKIIVAYEPVWAISTTVNRRDATPADSAEMAVFIRKTLSDMSSPEMAGKIRIIYGGSVNEKDAGEFLKDGGVEGVLPGRASLDPKKFVEIVKIAEKLN